jgi:hypothetical protein
MIRDLDDTLIAVIKARAVAGSLLAGADVRFDLPDAKWRTDLSKLTVNFYLYDIRENREMRTQETLIARSASGLAAARVAPPVRIDCAYCITAWSVATSDAVLEEHRLISQVLRALLQTQFIPAALLTGSLKGQIPPYPTVIASQDGVKNLPEFWNALDQKLKPSLNYVVTLAMMVDDMPADADMTGVVQTVTVDTEKVLPLGIDQG